MRGAAPASSHMLAAWWVRVRGDWRSSNDIAEVAHLRGRAPVQRQRLGQHEHVEPLTFRAARSSRRRLAQDSLVLAVPSGCSEMLDP